MADEYISKQAFNDAIREAVRKYPNTFYNGLEVARQIAHDMDAADVVPVVRCKDCKYCLQIDAFEYWCNGFCSPARLVRKEDFCSHGKAKD